MDTFFRGKKKGNFHTVISPRKRGYHVPGGVDGGRKMRSIRHMESPLFYDDTSIPLFYYDTAIPLFYYDTEIPLF